MVLRRLFRPNPNEEAARELYGRIVAQARRPGFYDAGGVPDSVDGRFDLIVLHMFLVLNRLKQERGRSAELSQAVFDLLFLDMDRSLREMGVGDIGVSKRIKAMVQAFYGRMAAYESALEAGEAAMQEALRRNLFGTIEADSARLASFAGYVRSAASVLAGQEMDALLKGGVVFSAEPDFLGPESNE